MAASTLSGVAGAQQPSQAIRPSYDPRTVAQELQALQALLSLREAQLRAQTIDAALADAIWRKEFAGWCGDRPACGLEPEKNPEKPLEK